MLFINTRPVGRAQTLHQVLQRNGYEVVNLPLLELLEIPYSEELAALYQKIHCSQIIVVVSPTAAEIGWRYLQQSGICMQALAHVKWIAVGQSTADYLKQFNIQAEVPQIETSEGMLQLDCFQASSGIQQVCFWRGVGGRQFMMQHLADRGIRILNFLLYRRRCPPQTEQELAQLAPRIQNSKAPVQVLISSEASWQYWLALLEKMPTLLGQCHYVVLGERLYQRLTAHQSDRHQDVVSCVENLKPETILARLKQA